MAFHQYLKDKNTNYKAAWQYLNLNTKLKLKLFYYKLFPIHFIHNQKNRDLPYFLPGLKLLFSASLMVSAVFTPLRLNQKS